MIKKLTYKTFSFIVRNLFSNLIISKQYDFGSKIYFNVSQNLGFFFQSKISYENSIKIILDKYLSKDFKIFDIGANIGQYSLYFSKIVGANGSVISFEPDNKNYSFLVFNLLSNNCRNVNPINAGIADKSSQMQLFTDSKTGGRKSSFILDSVENNYDGLNYISEVFSFDDIILQYYNPDFVKVDVEGFEIQVLKGLKKPNIGTVFLIEVRDNTKSEVFDYFVNNLFICFCVELNKVVNDSSEIPSFANLLFYHIQNNKALILNEYLQK